MIDVKDILNTVIEGDCLDIMRQLPDKCIDLVLTDPPYGIKQGGKILGRNNLLKNNTCIWNYKPDPMYFDEIKRISKHQIIWGGNYFNLGISRCYLVWDKKQPIKQFARCELAWTSFDKNSDIIEYPYYGNVNQDIREHPTQKPEYLFKYVLLNYTVPGMTIFDPFAGSGTTAIACLETGRNYILIEKEPDYVKIINNRIAQWKEQGRMFATC